MPDLPSTITLLGDGQMGLVLADLLARDTAIPHVRLWSHDPAEGHRLATTRHSPRLPHLTLHHAVTCTADDAEALADTQLIIVTTPTQFIRPVLTRLAPHIPPGIPCASVAKGVEIDTFLRPTQVIDDVLPRSGHHAVVSGPTIAAELARKLPATILAASDDPELATTLQTLLTTPWLRVYTHDDPVGVEYAGALKNVIALAAGMLDGLDAGCNAKSALLARGLAELVRFGLANNARAETFFGLAGVGDLATTCFSPEGRNRSCGEALGRGITLHQYLAQSGSVVEGIPTARAVHHIARQRDIDMPITAAVYAVLYEQLPPRDAVAQLMSRDPKAERVI